MDRFEYGSPLLLPNERYLIRDQNVRLYDGDQKTSFEGGELIITTHRILWARPGVIGLGQACLTLPLRLVVFIEEDSPGAFSFSRSRKVLLHLSNPPPEQKERPQPTSIYSFITLSYREGFSSDVVGILKDCIQRKVWEWNEQQPTTGAVAAKPSQPNIKLRTGIVGIERTIQAKQNETDESISLAFIDLSKLMFMAKDMVQLSRNISTKISEKQGNITQDETLRFKSYLLSLGIDDPVTREGYKCNSEYFSSLAKQICEIVQEPISDMGGMMTLSDVYCRVNRARGLELLSPDDLLAACGIMQSLNLPLKLFRFESDVMVLQLLTLSEENIASSTADLLNEKGSLNSQELAQHLGISITLAKERFKTTERIGKCCRDDSVEGLRFYPNWFLTRED